MKNTIEYYNMNSQTLCEKYDSIDLSVIHKDMLDFFKGCNTLLEIGSGSGRDMNYLIENGFDVIGVDGSEKMIREAYSNFPTLKTRIILSELPDDLSSFEIKFDGFFSIATLMHFQANELDTLFEKLIQYLKPDSPVFITVSGSRNIHPKEEKRFFLELSKEEWVEIFKNNNFEIIKVKENKDYTGRNINWYTFFLKTKI